MRKKVMLLAALLSIALFTGLSFANPPKQPTSESGAPADTEKPAKDTEKSAKDDDCD